jgi:hypothetical protein
MLGLSLLARLGRVWLAPMVADTGLLPAVCYRHLVLAALVDEDFPAALGYLKWAKDPVLAQVLVLRLRLLAEGHRRRMQTLEGLLQNGLPEARREKCRALLAEEGRALELLVEYEARACRLLRDVKRGGEQAPSPAK